MPVGFLRWWFLTPLAGRLFAATFTERRLALAASIRRRGHRAARGVLLARHAPARDAGASLGTPRRSKSAARSAAPSAGDSARYVDETSGLCVEVLLESIGTEPPSDEAFEDPDAPPRSPDSPGGGRDGDRNRRVRSRLRAGRGEGRRERRRPGLPLLGWRSAADDELASAGLARPFVARVAGRRLRRRSVRLAPREGPRRMPGRPRLRAARAGATSASGSCSARRAAACAPPSASSRRSRAASA